MPLSSTNQKLIFDKCISELPLSAASLSDEYYYDSLVFCIIDAIFSIGANYASTKNTVIKYCNHFGLRRIQVPKGSPSNNDNAYKISHFLRDTDSLADFGASSLYENKQRTSSRGGILKAEAVFRAAKIFQEYHIETLLEFRSASAKTICEIKEAFLTIPGQKSGISFDYLLMLSGDDSFMKIDRWLLRFCEDATRTTYIVTAAYKDLLAVAEELKIRGFPSLTPRLLDHTIWNHMR